MNPKVSVVIPVYNAELFVAEAIESILNQTYNNIEVIVVNDASTDSTGLILTGFVDRVKIITNKVNMGDPASRNRGITASSGYYYASMDADDVCLPDRILKEVEFIQSHEDCILVGGQAVYIDALGNILGFSNYPTKEEVIKRHIWRRNPVAHSSVLTRMDLVKRVGMYDESLRTCSDYDLWLRLLHFGYAGNLREAVIKYRIHSNQITQYDYTNLLKTTAFLQNKYKNLYNHKDNFVDRVYACGYWLLLKIPSKASNRIVNFFRKLARCLGVLRRQFYD